jgi:hypothetical protein
LPTTDFGVDAVRASCAGWEWKRWGSRFALSEDGLVATMGGPRANPLDSDDEAYDEGFDIEPCQAVMCGQPMTEGRHYWEVELTVRGDEDFSTVLFGAVRPGQDCDSTGNIEASSTSHFMIMSDQEGGNSAVSLFGNGKSHDADADGCDGDVSHLDYDEEYFFKQGDRIGFLLDLDAGWLRFYRNDKRLRQEFASGVTGPLLRCAELYSEGEVVTALPGAEMPADADL